MEHRLDSLNWKIMVDHENSCQNLESILKPFSHSFPRNNSWNPPNEAATVFEKLRINKKGGVLKSS